MKAPSASSTADSGFDFSPAPEAAAWWSVMPTLSSMRTAQANHVPGSRTVQVTVTDHSMAVSDCIRLRPPLGWACDIAGL